MINTYHESSHVPLLDLMNLLPMGFVGVVQTSDGFFLGRKVGDIGFNVCLGHPSPSPGGPGQERSANVWAEFSLRTRRAIVREARRVGVDLRVFLPRGTK